MERESKQDRTRSGERYWLKRRVRGWKWIASGFQGKRKPTSTLPWQAEDIRAARQHYMENELQEDQSNATIEKAYKLRKLTSGF